MSYAVPPIVKLAESLVVQVYQAVRGFHRYHKYTIGTELRQAAMRVAEYADRAWHAKGRQVVWTRRLVDAIDSLKVRMQIGSQLRAFADQLTCLVIQGQSVCAAANSAAGLGRPNLQARKRPPSSRRFFLARSTAGLRIALPGLWRAARGHRKVCWFLEPVDQPRAVRHLVWSRGDGLHHIQESSMSITTFPCPLEQRLYRLLRGRLHNPNGSAATAAEARQRARLIVVRIEETIAQELPQC